MPGQIAHIDPRTGDGLERFQNADPAVKRVLVGIALKGHTPPESYHDRMLMAYNLGCRQVSDHYAQKAPRYEFLWTTAGEIFIPYAREELAKQSLKFNADYLFMIDDDMLADPNLVFKLLEHDVDICGALAFTRNPPHNPVIYETVEGYDPSSGTRYGPFTRQVKSYPRNALMECDAIGFGCALIKTEVFRNMPQPWFMGSHGTGEDIYFCLQAKKCGFRVFMDTSQKMGHLSHPVVVTEEYADRFNGLSEEERERLYGRYQKYPTFELLK